MITANEARAISIASTAEIIAEIDKLIREAAEKKWRRITIPRGYVMFSGTSSMCFKNPEVREVLMDAGYAVITKCNDGTIPSYIEVSW
jgi:hypothetical protein